VTRERDEAEADYVEMHEAALAQLKPCPFCGASMESCCSGADKGILCFVMCAECGATIGDPGEMPETPIMDRWNRRVAAPQEGGPPPPAPVLAEALREIADQIGKFYGAEMQSHAARLRALAAQLSGPRFTPEEREALAGLCNWALGMQNSILDERVATVRGMLAEEGAQCEKAEPGTSSLDTPGPDHRS
jgi:hypothetical protein